MASDSFNEKLIEVAKKLGVKLPAGELAGGDYVLSQVLKIPLGDPSYFEDNYDVFLPHMAIVASPKQLRAILEVFLPKNETVIKELFSNALQYGTIENFKVLLDYFSKKLENQVDYYFWNLKYLVIYRNDPRLVKLFLSIYQKNTTDLKRFSGIVADDLVDCTRDPAVLRVLRSYAPPTERERITKKINQAQQNNPKTLGYWIAFPFKWLGRLISFPLYFVVYSTMNDKEKPSELISSEQSLRSQVDRGVRKVKDSDGFPCEEKIWIRVKNGEGKERKIRPFQHYEYHALSISANGALLMAGALMLKQQPTKPKYVLIFNRKGFSYVEHLSTNMEYFAEKYSDRNILGCNFRAVTDGTAYSQNAYIDDVIAAVDYLLNKGVKVENIHIIGESLGAAAVTLAVERLRQRDYEKFSKLTYDSNRSLSSISRLLTEWARRPFRSTQKQVLDDKTALEDLYDKKRSIFGNIGFGVLKYIIRAITKLFNIDFSVGKLLVKHAAEGEANFMHVAAQEKSSGVTVRKEDDMIPSRASTTYYAIKHRDLIVDVNQRRVLEDKIGQAPRVMSKDLKGCPHEFKLSGLSPCIFFHKQKTDVDPSLILEEDSGYDPDSSSSPSPSPSPQDE